MPAFFTCVSKKFFVLQNCAAPENELFLRQNVPEKGSNTDRIASFEGALWREKSRFSGDLSLSRVSLVEIWNKKKRKEERKTNFLVTQKVFLIYNSNLQGYQTRVTSARLRAEKI